MSSSNLDPGGGSDPDSFDLDTASDGATIGDFLHPDADSLWARVDFGGMLSVFFKSWIVGIFSFLAGIWLAIEGAIGEVFDASIGNVERLGSALTDGLSGMQESAAQAAASGVADFGIFAMPVGTVAVLAGLFSAAVILYFFVWGDT